VLNSSAPTTDGSASGVSDAASATPQPIPTGAYGALIRYGRDIIENTHKDMPTNVTAGMSCEATAK